jgi:DNA polymerase
MTEEGSAVHATSLAALRAAYRDCQRCALAQSRAQVVFDRGTPGAPLLVLTERIGSTDEQVGRPFAGPAGELLERLLAAPRVEIRRSDVYITNLVLCRTPADRSPRVGEIQACQERLRQEIALVAPRLLVILGRLPLLYFLGGKQGVERQRGWWTRQHMTGGLPAYVTFNPASVLHGDARDIRRKKLLMYEDWQAIAEAYRGQ